MGIFIVFIVIFVGVIIFGVIASLTATPEQVAQMQYGPINPLMVCPHCNSVGKIRTKPTTQKKGISGGKATAALLTGGISMLATGLSRKENSTQAHCTNCNNTWFF